MESQSNSQEMMQKEMSEELHKIAKHSEKFKGFYVVKNLMDKFPEFEYLIQGGSSSYLHTLNEKNVEIELYDIDILVGCEDIDTNSKIINFMMKNYTNIKFKNKTSSIFYVYIGNDIILNFIINEVEKKIC